MRPGFDQVCNTFMISTPGKEWWMLYMNMKRRIQFGMKMALVVMGMAIVFAGCHRKGPSSSHNPDNIEILRFEEVLFSTPLDQLQKKLVESKSDFNTPLIVLEPENEQYMEMVRGYVSDTVVGTIYKTVKERYGDLSWLEESLTPALKTSHELISRINPKKVYTMITGTFDYQNRVFCDDYSVVISIDQYVLPEMERYQYFGIPMYLVSLSDSAFILPDIVSTLAKNAIAIPEQEMTMLDYMIAEGKALYFLDRVLPDVEDCLKIRYTQEQMEWVKHNEGMIWAYFSQNNLLFETNVSRFRNFIDEAPKTNAFNESAPRTPSYIGWQIVKRYMQKNKVSMQQLFDETDGRKILTQSGYKPPRTERN